MSTFGESGPVCFSCLFIDRHSFRKIATCSTIWAHMQSYAACASMGKVTTSVVSRPLRGNIIVLTPVLAVKLTLSVRWSSCDGAPVLQTSHVRLSIFQYCEFANMIIIICYTDATQKYWRKIVKCKCLDLTTALARWPCMSSPKKGRKEGGGYRGNRPRGA